MKNHLRSIIALVMLLCLCCTLLVGCGAKEEAAPAPAEETQEAAAVQEPAEPAPEVTEEPAAEPEEEPAQEPVEEEGVVEIVAEANPSPDPNHKHTYKTWVDYPTCLHGGATYHKCTECGFMWFENIKGALGHWFATITYSNATCTQPGQLRDTCARCGLVQFRPDPKKPATGHNWQKVGSPTAATCTAASMQAYVCSKCGATKSGQESPALGHSLATAPSSTTAGDCIHPGTAYYPCTRCDYVQAVPTAPTGVHNYRNGACVVCFRLDPNCVKPAATPAPAPSDTPTV